MTARRTARVKPLVRAGMLTLALAIVAGASRPIRAEIIDRVLAVVHGALIMRSDVTAALELGLVTVEPGADPINAALPKLVDRELMLTEVERYAPAEPAAAAVDRRIQAVRARFSSPSDYAAALARSGLDQERVRRLIRDELRIDAYLDQRFPSDRRDELVSEWVSGLRRRTDIAYLYVPP